MHRPDVKRVLFVCVENANRSQMAEAFARIHGRDRIAASSAGSRPSGRIHPKALAAMAELGYDLSTHRSQSIDQVAGEEFDCVVTMGCGDQCPHIAGRRHEEWHIPDPRDMEPREFRQVRDLIEQKVKQLIEQLTSSDERARNRET